MPVVERNRLIRLVSIRDLVKMPVAEIEMEATATQGGHRLASAVSATQEKASQ